MRTGARTWRRKGAADYALGRQVSVTDGRGNVTRTAYDAEGRVSSTVDALGHATTYGYDALGRRIAVTDPLGHTVITAYDAEGRVVSERGATYPVDYAYDAYGNKVSMTTYRDESLSGGDTTRWLYDEPSGLMTNKVYADGKGPRYAYTPDGKLARRTWARGIVTDYAYDSAGNLTRIGYSDTTPTITMAYDRAGNLIEATTAGVVTNLYAYDLYGQCTNEWQNGFVLTRHYDAYGRNTGYALNGVRQSTLAYDPATGRLATMLAAGSETPFEWSYLGGSDLKSSLVYPNGLIASWDYDANNQLLQVQNAALTNVVSQYDYTYDAAGRRIEIAKGGSAFVHPDSVAYGYNARSELTNAVAAVDENYRYSYDFDPIGNREKSSERGTNTTYAANELNQYTAINTDVSASSASPRETFTPQFDDDGNQTLVKTATGIWSVTYNGENRPILWTCGTTNIVMSYDRMGRRRVKNDQRFVYNGYLQVADNAGNAYVWDPTEPIATRPLVWLNSALTHPHSALYYVHDGNKNVSEVVASDGTLAAHYEYAPFGALTISRGVDTNVCNSTHIHYSLLPIRYLNPWRFSSEFADDELGCDYYNYREYEPVTGRWLGRDLIEEEGGLGLYISFLNCGVTDFLGLKWDVSRAGAEHAKAKANDTSDTFEDLAHEVKLDYEEYKIWANTDDDTPDLCKEYEVPNVISIYVSKPHFLDGIVSFAFRLRRRAKGEAGDYQKQGYKVDLYWLEEDEEIFKSMWNKDGIYGVVFAGHGSKGGYIADDSGFEVNPFTISLKYKLAIVHAYSCYSADSLITGNSTADGGQEYDTWRNKVSKEGEFIGYSGWAFHWSDPVTAR